MPASPRNKRYFSILFLARQPLFCCSAVLFPARTSRQDIRSVFKQSNLQALSTVSVFFANSSTFFSLRRKAGKREKAVEIAALRTAPQRFVSLPFIYIMPFITRLYKVLFTVSTEFSTLFPRYLPLFSTTLCHTRRFKGQMYRFW